MCIQIYKSLSFFVNVLTQEIVREFMEGQLWFCMVGLLAWLIDCIVITNYGATSIIEIFSYNVDGDVIHIQFKGLKRGPEFQYWLVNP